MDSEIIEKSLPVVILKSITYVLLILFGSLGNACILHMPRREKSLHTIPNLYIANLALADLVYVITCIPVLLLRTIAGRWLLGNAMCNMIGLLNSVLCTVSIWTLVLIGVNRCLAVTRPLQFRYGKYSLGRNVKMNLAIIATIWAPMFVCSFPPVVGWGTFRPGRNSCYIYGKIGKSYAMTFVGINYLLPGIVIVALYVKIYTQIKRINRTRQRLFSSFSDCSLQEFHQERLRNISEPPDLKLRSVSVLTTESQLSAIATGVQRNKLEAEHQDTLREFKTTRLMFTVLVAFFICWTPFSVGATLFSFKVEPKEFCLVAFGVIMASLNSVINPLIYAAKSKDYRRAIAKLFRCI